MMTLLWIRPDKPSPDKPTLSLRHSILFCILLLFATACPAVAEDQYDQALHQVQTLGCLDSENIEAYLNRKLKPSHRDLGWQVFQNDYGFDVERTFMASKSMELRYRWRLHHNGELNAISERAKTLCS